MVLALLLVVPGVSYAQALTYPGSASWQDRTVEWVRDHGGGGAVNAVENWLYSRQVPSQAAPAPVRLPGWDADRPGAAPALPAPTSRPASRRSGVLAAATAPPALPVLSAWRALAGEGVWVPGRVDAAGRPALFTSYLRPDPRYAGVVVGVAWIRSADTVAHLVPGTREPGGIWPGTASVPAADVPGLVATFNSGWRTRDHPGGFYLDGAGAGTLQDGLASLVIDRSGHVRVGQWGRDVTMSADVRAVRQNLHLVVDGGAPVPGLPANADDRWGSPYNQHQYTWRSGIGTDKHGNLVYVAGAGLTLATLADAMTAAGIDRGMELDIHKGKVAFASWHPVGAGVAAPKRLLPDMPSLPDRYLAPDQRDFFYLTLGP
ncbi:phosphodiester glycosidase family protein [Georgenia sp. SYP-B2076]|uniref:phosphodiester glycosidase family protein n=1 Tax=Georgenia sp. SYP-B2076 TaxID=2495881 RepID=UPI000F8DB350|nr:phosphodiester glycosidase family protein [Georgenia sp. SYP-B2076]